VSLYDRRPVTFDWPKDSQDAHADRYGWPLDAKDGEPRRWVHLTHSDGSKKRAVWTGFWRTQRPHTEGLGPWRFVHLWWSGHGHLRVDLSTGASAAQGPAWLIDAPDLAILRQAFEERRAPVELVTVGVIE
jgi:hypothetical protein